MGTRMNRGINKSKKDKIQNDIFSQKIAFVSSVVFTISLISDIFQLFFGCNDAAKNMINILSGISVIIIYFVIIRSNSLYSKISNYGLFSMWMDNIAAFAPFVFVAEKLAVYSSINPFILGILIMAFVIICLDYFFNMKRKYSDH